MLFSNILKHLRIKSNLTQKDMANILGIGDRQYQRYESDNVDPPLSNVIKISDYFDVSLDYLTGRSNEEQNQTISQKFNFNESVYNKFNELSNENKIKVEEYIEFVYEKQLISYNDKLDIKLEELYNSLTDEGKKQAKKFAKTLLEKQEKDNKIKQSK